MRLSNYSEKAGKTGVERRVEEVREGNKMKTIHEGPKHIHFFHPAFLSLSIYIYIKVSMWSKLHVCSIMHKTVEVLHELDPSSGPAVC